MHDLSVRAPSDRPLRVLLLGAHSDDLEIGCGGAILELIKHHPTAEITWVVFSADEVREAEARTSAAAFLDGARHTVVIEHFRESFFPEQWAQLKECFEQLKPVDPDIIFAHSLADSHQDHRTVGELVWNTFRDHLVLQFEIPKYEGDLGQPQIYAPLPIEVVRRKVDTLMTSFPSQVARPWFTASTFEGLMRIRGVESNAPSGYAEAFHLLKGRLGWVSS